jgi:hypothetical protein
MSLTQGKAGGLAVVRKRGTNWMTKIGRKGGLSTAARYGQEYMSLLGTLADESLAPSRRARIEGRLRRIVSENQ